MLKNCLTCGEEFEAQRSTAKFCSDECRYHKFLLKRKRITIPRDLRFTILMRDGFACRYCGARPPQKQLKVDHVVSVEEGGAITDTANLVTACNDCNSGKGQRSLNVEDIPDAPED